MKQTLLLAALILTGVWAAPNVEAGSCPADKRFPLPDCVDTSVSITTVVVVYGVENYCTYPIDVLIDLKSCGDVQLVVPAGEMRLQSGICTVRNWYCCTDNPDTWCIDENPGEIVERDRRPRYKFEIRIKAAMYAPDFPHSWDARFACHKWSSGWEDRIVEPDERWTCDARYGAHAWFDFHSGADGTVHIYQEAPRDNPCGSGQHPAYRVTQGADEGLTYSAHIEWEKADCEW